MDDVQATGEPVVKVVPAAHAIRDASREGGIAISAITLWELAWLMTNGRLDISGTVEAFVEAIAAGQRDVRFHVLGRSSKLGRVTSRE